MEQAYNKLQQIEDIMKYIPRLVSIEDNQVKNVGNKNKKSLIEINNNVKEKMKNFKNGTGKKNKRGKIQKKEKTEKADKREKVGKDKPEKTEKTEKTEKPEKVEKVAKKPKEKSIEVKAKKINK
jgi:hypothetical protein